MADSIRLQILKALTDHLKGITPANGYPYDLSNAVFRGRLIFGEDSPLPMLSILEAPRSNAGVEGGEYLSARSETWNLLLQGWVNDDPENPTDPAYGLMDAVETRLSLIVKTKDDGSGRAHDKAVFLLGGLIGSLQFGPGVVRPPAEGVSSKAFFYLPVRVNLARIAG